MSSVSQKKKIDDFVGLQELEKVRQKVKLNVKHFILMWPKCYTDTKHIWYYFFSHSNNFCSI